MMAFTHAQLVDIGQRWLTGYARCAFAFAEYGSGPEVPDLLGFLDMQDTVLIECKASRSDFLADRKKPWRQRPETGMGDWRYYLTPKGLLKPDELPERWGLLEVDSGGRVRRTKELAITTATSKGQLDWAAHVLATTAADDPRFLNLRAWHAQVEAERSPKAQAYEAYLLFSAARRLHVKGCWGILKTDPFADVQWHVGPCPETIS